MELVFVVLLLIFVVFPVINLVTGRDTETRVNRERRELNELAAVLGMERLRGRDGRLRGTVDGVRLLIGRHIDTMSVDAEIDTGLGNFKIRKGEIRSHETAPQTGNPIFDSTFRIRSSDPAEVNRYLTPVRQEALLTLHGVFDFDELEEDEVEVRVPMDDWNIDDAVAAIELIVRAAHVLARDGDQSTFQTGATPQDVVRGRPQDRVR